MAKYEQYTYKKGVRPAGEPSASTNFRDASPRPQSVGPSRRIHRVADTSVAPVAPVKTPTKTVSKSEKTE
jgi:hypothetical protein